MSDALPQRPGAGTGQAGDCAQCGAWVDVGPDACLGLIPGVSNACCGHGKAAAAYVSLGASDDQLCIRGDDALTFFALIRKAQTVEANKAA